MTAEKPVQSRTLDTPRDARDLQHLLYREIGISAVAAALHIDRMITPEPKPDHPLPAVLRGEDLAA